MGTVLYVCMLTQRSRAWHVWEPEFSAAHTQSANQFCHSTGKICSIQSLISILGEKKMCFVFIYVDRERVCMFDRFLLLAIRLVSSHMGMNVCFSQQCIYPLSTAMFANEYLCKQIFTIFPRLGLAKHNSCSSMLIPMPTVP